ncbi:MAG: hypothetical protein WBX15_11975 [Thermoanaerobaculia bacterium]
MATLLEAPVIERAGDEKGAVENEMQKILWADGSEVLGYSGSGREEHSGESSGPAVDLEPELTPEEIARIADETPPW